MLEFCGKQFRVYKRADKVCDTIEWQQLRRMVDTVHLQGLRCSGAAHGGCQAGCLVHWKEAWLRRVNQSTAHDTIGSAVATRESLYAATRVAGGSDEEPIYSCQATELLKATTAPLPWWNPGQYVRDIRSGNASVLRVARGLTIGFFNKFQQANTRLLPRLRLIARGVTYPFLHPRAAAKIAPSTMNLQPGELVEVKSKREIEETLDARQRTRGLRFDQEMLAYCGRRGRVLRRVEKLIDESSGKMVHIHTDCIVIEGFVCTGDLHRFCPRSVFPYWREAWLKRVED
jgi:hypothetical protein